MTDGEKIGEVDDLIIDTTHWTVSDVYVDGKPGRGLIAFADLRGIGPDAVTIEQSNGVAYNVKTNGLSFHDLKGIHVVDSTGTARGNVVEMTYTETGAIESFEIRQGGVFGIGAQVTNVSPSSIRGLGDKILTVDLPPLEA